MQAGEVFDGRYRIVRMLGQGGMSRVYLAENIKLGTLWAIKEISKNSDLKVDFLAEPNILKRLDHPALPRIFDIIDEKDNIYVIVDYIEGVSLDVKLKEEGKFAEAMVIEWAVQLCGVLDYLHSCRPNPIIYRDMKPSNIILSINGILKLIDFGIAREYKALSDGDTVYIGTRGYAAPEQYGTGQTSVAADIYSLGVTLYQFLTGKSPNEPPYEIKPVRYFDRNLSSGIERIICKCTRQNPSERYQSVNELLNDIRCMKKESDSVTYSVNKNALHYTAGKAVPFKKLVLTVWDSAEFGCEFAYMASRLSGYSVMLIDLDLLAPKADLFLNLGKYAGRLGNSAISDGSGLNIVLDSIDKNFFTTEILLEASMSRKDAKNLFVLTGNYKIENYEYYRNDSLLKLIEKSYQYFDITVLLVNRSIYDLFTVISLAKSDYNLLAIRAYVDFLREYNRYLVFLKEKQHIPPDKTKIIAFEYDKATGLGISELREATGNNFLGKVAYSRKRAAYRNVRASYACHMEREIVSEYSCILSYFNILPAYGFISRLADWIKSILHVFATAGMKYGKE